MQDIKIGSIVVIDRFPDTKWVVCSGWFVYEEENHYGTYLKSIPAGSTIPLTAEDAANLIIISDGTNCPTSQGYHPCMPPQPPSRNEVEVYISGVDYIRGQLVYLNVGDVYQAYSDFTSCAIYEDILDNFNEDIKNGRLLSVQGLASGNASESRAGLMSVDDYKKLSAFESADKYVKFTDIELVSIEEIDMMFPEEG